MSAGTALAAILAAEAKRRARKWAEADARDLGEWRGKAEFDQIGRVERKILGFPVSGSDVVRVLSDPADPLRLLHFGSGLEYRAELDFTCDLGSIPKLLRGVGGELLALGPWDFKRSYHLHDSLYATGRAWARDPKDPRSVWTPCPVGRVEADILLYWGLTAEGANNATTQAVYRAVRAGGAIPWRKHREREEDAKRKEARGGQDDAGVPEAVRPGVRGRRAHT